MYYRRKIILVLLQMFDGSLARMEFQKYLFLLTTLQDKAAFDFVPYKYGCFSFQSYEDIVIMAKQGILQENDRDSNTIRINSSKKDSVDYISVLKSYDKYALYSLKERFGKFSKNDLIKYVYKTYPFYAINSKIVNEHLTESEIEAVVRSRPISNSTCVFTIGYEGKSIDYYLKQLIMNDIRLLCDIRSNPISRKCGFSKNQLSKFVSNVKINYIHYPELGIDSSMRKSHTTQNDYNALFRTYSESILPSHTRTLNDIYCHTIKYKRVALTCFENDYQLCHRKIVAKELINRYELNIVNL
ncbi:MAG: DUF488 family protein [Nitrospirae bacterium]|nr:DUF488 family protein [Nitrospirota bacterium]